MRITWPSLLGVKPRSDFMMAFSIKPSVPRSQGWITSRRDSGRRDAGQLVERRRRAVILDVQRARAATARRGRSESSGEFALSASIALPMRCFSVLL